jgi:hypothetical protein
MIVLMYCCGLVVVMPISFSSPVNDDDIASVSFILVFYSLFGDFSRQCFLPG